MYLLQASTCRVLCLRTTICGQHWFFVVTWRKMLQNRIECLSKLTVNILLAKHSVSSGLKNSKVVILMWETKIVENHRKSSKTGSEGCYLLWAAKTWWNCQHESLPTANDRIKSSITRKNDRIIEEGNTKSFFFTIMPHHTQRKGSRKRSRRSVGK